MKIIKHEIVPETDMLARLKKTRLRGFDQAEVYKDATLRISVCDTEWLVPPQKYVLKDGVQNIFAINDAFAAIGVDIFAQRGALLFWTDEMDPEKDAPIPLLPAIVEESFERDGKMILLINDGMHRLYAARALGRKPTIVRVQNVPLEYPYYAYPLAGGWAEVEVIPELTEGYEKKEYRNPENYKALFRDFNAVFDGVQKQRPKTGRVELKE